MLGIVTVLILVLEKALEPIVCTTLPLANVRLVRLEQLENALSPTSVTVFEIVTDVRPELWKALFPIFITPLKENDVRAEQPEKALAPISVILVDPLIVFSFEQEAKILAGILVTSLVKLAVVRFEQLWNTPVPNVSTVVGIVTS